MKVLITGADGFIGKNLRAHLAERNEIEIHCFTRSTPVTDLPVLLQDIDVIFHLAGVNRPQDPGEFVTGNTDLTHALCSAWSDMIISTGRKVPILFTSSIQAVLDNPYGQTKRAAEDLLLSTAHSHDAPVHIFRLPNVFGKWCRPNYNSVVATFCHNIARDLPIHINDPSTALTLVYIDDVIHCLMDIMAGNRHATPFVEVAPQYNSTVGSLAAQLYAFRDSRSSLITEPVGKGLVRALHSTYLSYLPPDHFTYPLPQYGDPRGVFAEVLKTRDSGQFSFFTARPGVTRGGHYHHSKTEKFLVLKGKARFRFKQIMTDDYHEVFTDGDHLQVVETVPGWTHDITNVGHDEMVVMLWANEIFDREHPDTFAFSINSPS